MPLGDDFDAIFGTLSGLLREFVPPLTVTEETATRLYLTALGAESGAQMFAAVQWMKGHVGFYYMPVSLYPDMSADIPPTLLAKRSGKTCFRFKSAEGLPLAELRKLMRTGIRRFRAARLLPGRSREDATE